MTWEYLDSPEFAIRDRWIREVGLSDRRDFSLVVDLNCGGPRMYEWFRGEIGFDFWYGNDIRIEPKVRPDYYCFENIPDNQVAARIGEVCKRESLTLDLLLVLGDGAGDHTKELLESQTLSESFSAIVTAHKPRLVVYECIKKFETEYALLSQRTVWMKTQGYRVARKSELIIGDSGHWLNHRVMVVYERGE